MFYLLYSEISDTIPLFPAAVADVGVAGKLWSILQSILELYIIQ